MALILKRFYETYFYLMDEASDPRANDYFLMRSPIPTMIILYFWYNFVFKWGPDYMKNREPFLLKNIMILYNGLQVFANVYIVYYLLLSIHIIDWSCSDIDYSESYWGRKHLFLTYCYFLLKIADLIDTIFFILRKKSTHVSFLHTYHHFLMVVAAWIGVKYLGGGHSYFLGLANCIVHSILYAYYLLTAYDSKYGQLLWLKKFITQVQLAQFVGLFVIFVRALYAKNCNYPKYPLFMFIPQNAFMIVLFSDFYIKTYITGPRRKRKLEEQAKKEGVANYSTKSS
ncbi:very long chain fatty acid elongase AAEL008004-like [Euwallacea similis]|uniref:very long chain fatty acid elongase AAEL008004-like n=1 Tax=Euwallacea similis TaxID=1736056 RepID=UPI00344B13D2